ncbi:transcriptional regulator [Dyadobacter sp. CY326]|uniref:transcriptional regulator n=1 Tax=Dyadobacter sp. CY326 TaxID=2907300 RepID=UPI001F3BD3A7|nr:transcriptional regulator [Dyadobacter sp. CY326]MCE7065526.1 transcriptional regulator [Dyadobacter sp. CY326]
MDTNQRSDEMISWDARDIIRKGKIDSELERERAVWVERSLNLLSREQPELEVLRKQIFDLILQYESRYWSDFDSIPKQQFKESDRAEKQAKKEFKFFKRRKELIVAKLKMYGLNQNDLAEILAHSKSYTSELLNTIRAFSIGDLIIIHRLFDIELDDLIHAEVPAETMARINQILQKVASDPAKTKKFGKAPDNALPGTAQRKASKKKAGEYRKHSLNNLP